MPRRQPKPDHNGQGVLPGCAHYRPKSRRVNGRRRGDETALCDAVQEVCDHRPGIVLRAWRNNAGMAFLRHGGAVKLAPAGAPDLVGLLVDGRMIGIEAKLPGEKLDPEQVEWQSLFARARAPYLVVHSREECAAMIEALALLPWVHVETECGGER